MLRLDKAARPGIERALIEDLAELMAGIGQVTAPEQAAAKVRELTGIPYLRFVDFLPFKDALRGRVAAGGYLAAVRRDDWLLLAGHPRVARDLIRNRATSLAGRAAFAGKFQAASAQAASAQAASGQAASGQAAEAFFDPGFLARDVSLFSSLLAPTALVLLPTAWLEGKHDGEANFDVWSVGAGMRQLMSMPEPASFRIDAKSDDGLEITRRGGTLLSPTAWMTFLYAFQTHVALAAFKR
jgi:hypothetical protein